MNDAQLLSIIQYAQDCAAGIDPVVAYRAHQERMKLKNVS